jgi:L-ascorbate metabolism protein UlaG (beta-lactamase superfamily)
MSPKEAAYACRLMNARRVVPMHYGTFPPLVGRPDELRELTRELDAEIFSLAPGEVLLQPPM